MNKDYIYIIGVLLFSALAAMGFRTINKPTIVEPQGQQPNAPAIEPGEDSAVQAVSQDIAKRTGVKPEIISVIAKNWSNSCLGVEKPGIMCAQIVTPGYEIKARAQGKEYIYHTNSNGKAVILAE